MSIMTRIPASVFAAVSMTGAAYAADLPAQRDVYGALPEVIAAPAYVPNTGAVVDMYCPTSQKKNGMPVWERLPASFVLANAKTMKGCLSAPPAGVVVVTPNDSKFAPIFTQLSPEGSFDYGLIAAMFGGFLVGAGTDTAIQLADHKKTIVIPGTPGTTTDTVTVTDVKETITEKVWIKVRDEHNREVVLPTSIICKCETVSASSTPQRITLENGTTLVAVVSEDKNGKLVVAPVAGSGVTYKDLQTEIKDAASTTATYSYGKGIPLAANEINTVITTVGPDTLKTKPGVYTNQEVQLSGKYAGTYIVDYTVGKDGKITFTGGNLPQAAFEKVLVANGASATTEGMKGWSSTGGSKNMQGWGQSNKMTGPNGMPPKGSVYGALGTGTMQGWGNGDNKMMTMPPKFTRPIVKYGEKPMSGMPQSWGAGSRMMTLPKFAQLPVNEDCTCNKSLKGIQFREITKHFTIEQKVVTDKQTSTPGTPPTVITSGHSFRPLEMLGSGFAGALAAGASYELVWKLDWSNPLRTARYDSASSGPRAYAPGNYKP